MSLNWNIKKCSRPPEEHERVIMDTLIKLTMVVGMGEITEKNKGEFYARVHLLDKVDGGFMSIMTEKGLTDRPITPEDIERWVGLTTNVGNTSRAAFLKTISNRMDRYARSFNNNKTFFTP